jgi:hypothetical protein
MKLKTCFICNIVIGIHDGHHLYSCAKKHNLILPKEDIKFKQISHMVDFEITKEYFLKRYIEEEWSLVDFKENHGLDYKSTLFLLGYLGIPTRSVVVATNNKRTREKYKTTCIEKYGVENVSQNTEVKEKKCRTFIAHYGVDNIWKSKDYYRWLYEYMVLKYGKGSLSNKNGQLNVWWSQQSKEYKKQVRNKLKVGYDKWYNNLSDEQIIAYNISRSRHLVGFQVSKLESRIATLLVELGIPFKHQFWVKQRSYDFKIHGLKLLLEINGDFWHANPEIYKADDILNHPQKISAKDIWEKDKNKTEIANSYGFRGKRFYSTYYPMFKYCFP